MTSWTAADIPDLSGRTIVVTGTTSGLGLETAIAVAAHGASVVVTGRNQDRLASALVKVEAAATGVEPTSVLLDLADLSSVRAAADQILSTQQSVHVVINNAGVMATPMSRTVDGFELQIGTNHLGHFALTGLLLPGMPVDNAGVDTRVVSVASLAHRSGRVDPADLSFDRRRFSPWDAYGQSKLANLLFIAELQRRALLADWSLKAVAAHPGLSATNLAVAGPKIAQNPVGRFAVKIMSSALGQSAKDGALPTLYAATDPSILGGEYIGPGGPFEARGHPKRVGRNAAALNETTMKELWEASTELTGVDYGI